MNGLKKLLDEAKTNFEKRKECQRFEIIPAIWESFIYEDI